MGLARRRYVGVVDRGITALPGLLLYDDTVAVFLVQEVETALYAQYFAEEGRLQHHFPAVVVADGLGQVCADEFLYVAFLYLGIILELQKAFSQPVAGYKSQHMVVRIVAESILEGDILPVYRLVEQLSG